MALHAVKMALVVGVKNIWLEGDSFNIIKCINGISHPAWTITNVVEEIQTALGKFERVYVNHVYREVNSVADWFANEVVNKDTTMMWYNRENILVAMKDLVNLERIQGSTGAILS